MGQPRSLFFILDFSPSKMQVVETCFSTIHQKGVPKRSPKEHGSMEAELLGLSPRNCLELSSF
jgi:hypothetical protein